MPVRLPDFVVQFKSSNMMGEKTLMCVFDYQSVFYFYHIIVTSSDFSIIFGKLSYMTTVFRTNFKILKMINPVFMSSHLGEFFER